MSFETTKNYEKYLQYKQLKQKFNCEYKGIDMMKVMSIDIVETFVCERQKTWRNIFIALLRQLNTSVMLDAFCCNKTVFTFDASIRKDHWDLITAMAKDVEDAAIVSLQYYYKFWFSPILFIKYYFCVAREINTTFKNRLFLTARCLFFIRVINSLNKIFAHKSFKAEIYVPFCSQTYTEACLTLFFKQKGLKTFNLFHGIFGRYKMFITNDIVAGENILADNILAFNETQKQDLINDFDIKENRISIAGNPKYPIKKITVKNSFKSCIILGGISPYDKYLESLLLILDKVSETEKISFCLKPHLLSKIIESNVFKHCKNIRLFDKNITLRQIFNSEDYDFAITHNTSSYYECMYYDILPLRWGSGENLDFEGFDDKFYDEKSFLRIIEKYKNEDMNTVKEQLTKILINSYGMGINRYGELIK